MRILMVTSLLPYAGSVYGGALVMYGQLMALAMRHEVTLVTFAGPDPAEKAGIASLRTSGVNVNYVWRSEPTGLARWGQRWRLGYGWLRGGCPLRTLLFTTSEMQQLIDRLLSEQQFDLLQIEDNAMGNYHYRTHVPTVLTDHEVRPGLASEHYGLWESCQIQHLLRRGEQRRWLQYQSNVWRRFNRIQVFTPYDAATIKSIAPEVADQVRINPFGINLPAAADPSNEVPNTIVFVGGFLHPPNVDAALWLGNEIMPRLRLHRPDTRLIIVGSNPPESVRTLTRNDLIVTGRVPAVEPYLEQAAVVVAPLRMGGGMRVKVLQAMALGKAVVTTPLGAEGLAITGCQLPLAIAEEAQEFADVIAAFLSSTSARRKLGDRARAFIAEHYSWSAYSRRLEAIYAELQALTFSKTRFDALHEMSVTH